MIDTNNYYPERDGHIRELDDESTTTAELLQSHLPTSKVIKAFNHINAAALTTDGQAAGTPNRRALAIAGDDQAAKAVVSRLIDQFGFDVVDVGPLKEGWRYQRDTPGYGPRRTAEALRKDLAAARRYANRCADCSPGDGSVVGRLFLARKAHTASTAWAIEICEIDPSRPYGTV